ncbi:hypothetical protein Pelo_12418 [Pelomyxa schiedti]|nr:hypothetical protein Pelo_12418 [Pelomyxa schiedti]
MSDYLTMMLKLTEMERHQNTSDLHTSPAPTQPSSPQDSAPSSSEDVLKQIIAMHQMMGISFNSANANTFHTHNNLFGLSNFTHPFPTPGVPTIPNFGSTTTSRAAAATNVDTARTNSTQTQRTQPVSHVSPPHTSPNTTPQFMPNAEPHFVPGESQTPSAPMSISVLSSPTNILPQPQYKDNSTGETISPELRPDTRPATSQSADASSSHFSDFTEPALDDSCSPVRVTLPAAKLYFGKPLKLSICVVQSWRLAAGITHRQIFTSGLNMICVASSTSEPQKPEVHCFKCKKYTGRNGKVFKVWVDNYFPDTVDDSPIEQYCFMVQSLCTSSRDHLGGAVQFVVHIGDLTITSKPLHLRARIKKTCPGAPTPTKAPHTKAKKEIEKFVAEKRTAATPIAQMAVGSFNLSYPLSNTITVIPVTVRILSIKLPKDVVSNAVMQHRSFHMTGVRFQKAQVVEPTESGNAIWAIVTLFENVSSANLSNSAWSTAMKHLVESGFITLFSLFKSWE